MSAQESGAALRLPVWLVVIAGLGVTLQFVATGDPLLDLTYFTILSALLLGGSTAVSVLPSLSAQARQRVALIRGAATVGSVVSGLVYAVAIAPGESAGSGPWLWQDPLAAAASLVLHALLPVIAVLVFAMSVRPALPVVAAWKIAALWTIWPTLWAVLIGLGDGMGILRVPYRFLDQGEVGSASVVIAVVGMVVLCLGLGWALLRWAKVPTSARKTAPGSSSRQI